MVGWSGRYEVSSFGQVRSLDRWVDQRDNRGRPLRKFYAGKVLLQKLAKTGYLNVGLSDTGKVRWFGTHRLVCAAFHGTALPGTEAAHGDGVRTNNRADNLRWATRTENAADRKQHGRGNQGQAHCNAKLTDDQVREIRAMPWPRYDGDRTRRVAAAYGISVATLRAVRRGDAGRWQHI